MTGNELTYVAPTSDVVCHSSRVKRTKTLLPNETFSIRIVPLRTPPLLPAGDEGEDVLGVESVTLSRCTRASEA